MKQASTLINTIVLDGPSVSRAFLSKIGLRINKIREVHYSRSQIRDVSPPKLGVLAIGEERADAGSYLTQKKNDFAEMNLDLQVMYVSPASGRDGVMQKLVHLNEDPSFNGIMMYLPLPAGLRDSTVNFLQSIHPEKDVECINPDFRASQFAKLDTGSEKVLIQSVQNMVLPCTYMACLHVLEEYRIETAAKKAVIIGNGLSVGKPVASMLRHRGAQVNIYDKSDGKLRNEIRDADVIVTATGSKNLFDLNDVKEGCTVLDLGLTSLGDGKYRGDVPYDKLIGKAGLVTPVPKGIGPITSAMLIRNLVLLWEKQLFAGRTLEELEA